MSIMLFGMRGIVGCVFVIRTLPLLEVCEGNDGAENERDDRRSFAVLNSAEYHRSQCYRSYPIVCALARHRMKSSRLHTSPSRVDPTSLVTAE